MIDPAKVLAGLPAGLRDPLLASYRQIASNYAEHRWEPSELNGGKFCEVVYSVLDGSLSGAYATTPAKPASMVDACRALERTPEVRTRVGDRSLRILLPRALPMLYEIRNNRGVGHVGGDVDPNFLDATAVHGLASWVLAELVRIFHGVSTDEAQKTVDALIERKHPLVWEIGDVRRILKTNLTVKQQVLALLYGKVGWVSEAELLSSTEYSRSNNFRAKVLLPLHAERMIEFDRRGGRVHISPLGVSEAEKSIFNSRVG